MRKEEGGRSVRLWGRDLRGMKGDDKKKRRRRERRRAKRKRKLKLRRKD